MIISVITQVDFFLPGIGRITQIYDANSIGDMATWYANAKLYSQIHVKTLKSIELDEEKDEEEIERFSDIKVKAREMARDMTHFKENPNG